jgi:prefoldin subunit 5
MFQLNTLSDVIGAFHEIGYTQLVPGGRKLQVNLKLKDHAYVIYVFSMFIRICMLFLCANK